MAANPRSAGGAVLVTGASSGIGETCALHLDRLGYQVFAGVRKESDGQAIRGKASRRLTPVLIDVTDSEMVRATVATLTAGLNHVGLAGLVNNAGIVVAGPLEFLPLAELRQLMEVNVIGLLQVTQGFLPLLRRGKGRIVNIGSIAGRSSLPFMGGYASTKFALEALTDSLRMELLPWSVSVSIIEPGSVATPIWEKSRARADELAKNLPPEAHDLYGRAQTAVREAARRAFQRAIPPERVAHAVVQALTARRPKTRYVVGMDARLRLALRLLPDRLCDTVIRRALGLPRNA